MAATTSGYVLFILGRTDMASMTGGMFGAHCAHAAKHADRAIGVLKEFGDDWASNYVLWSGETEQGFGTVVTLDCGTVHQVREAVSACRGCRFPAGVTHDPEYPVRDGQTLHLVPTDTCGWAFGPPDAVKQALGQPPYYP